MAQASAKKISIFPFEVIIESAGAVFKANGVKLNTVGMMLEVFVNKLTPGLPVNLKWILPLDQIPMEEEAKVIKLYSQQKEDHIQYLIEVHFKKIKFQNSEAIKSLLERYEAALKKQSEKKG